MGMVAVPLSTCCVKLGTVHQYSPRVHPSSYGHLVCGARVFGRQSLPVFRVSQRVVTTPVAQIEEPSTTTTASSSSSVCFKTTVGLAFGEVVKVVGGGDSLGNWEVEAAPAMTWGEGNEWTLELDMPAGEHSFKFVVYNQGTGESSWEDGDDRAITVEASSQPAFVRGNWGDTAATEVAAVVMAGEEVPSALPVDTVVLIQREAEDLQTELDGTAAYVKAMLEALEDQEQQVAEKLEQTVKDAKLENEVAGAMPEAAVMEESSTEEERILPAEQSVQVVLEQLPPSVVAKPVVPDTVDAAVEDIEEETVPAAVEEEEQAEDEQEPTTVDAQDNTTKPSGENSLIEQKEEPVVLATEQPPAAQDLPAAAPAPPATIPIILAAEKTPTAPTPTSTLAPKAVSPLVSVPVALAVALAAPIVLWSEVSLRATGCGLQPGPGGLLGAVEGLSYLVVFVVALAGVARIAGSRGNRTGDVGLLGAAEAVSFLTLGIGVLVLLWQVKEYGYIPGAVPDARCFPDQVDIVFDPSPANWSALVQLLKETAGL